MISGRALIGAREEGERSNFMTGLTEKRNSAQAASESWTIPTRNSSRPTVRQLARAHTFRFLTTIAGWTLIVLAFIYHPEWIRNSLRFLTHAIEMVAEQVPEPWSSRLEVLLRELGGIMWVQIATVIVLLRLVLWTPFHLWTLLRGRNQRRP